MLLTASQRDSLNKAVIDYLRGQNVAPNILDGVASALNVPAASPGATGSVQAGGLGASPLGLETKWMAVIRLQRKILDLEAHIAALEQDHNLPPAHTVTMDDWLPRLPAALELKGHRAPVTALAFHPVWNSVVSACEDGTIKVWDAESGELERTLRAHTRSVTSVDFGAASGYLASSSGDLSVKVWDPTNSYANIRTLMGHDHTVSSVRFVPPQDALLVSASRDRTVRVWQLDTGYCIRVIRGHSDWVRALAPSFDGQLFVSAGSDRQARIVTVDGGETRAVAAGHDHVIECCAIAPPKAARLLAKLRGIPALEDERALHFFATGSRDKNIIVWDARGERVHTFEGHDNWVRGLVFHPNGRHLLSVSDDKTMRAWDLESGKLVRTIVAHTHFATAIAWGGHKMVATGSIDTQVKVWK